MYVFVFSCIFERVSIVDWCVLFFSVTDACSTKKLAPICYLTASDMYNKLEHHLKDIQLKLTVNLAYLISIYSQIKD